MNSYVELHLRGDAYMSGYTNGMTHCQTASTKNLELVSADKEKTVYTNPAGQTVTQYHIAKGDVTEYWTVFENTGKEPVWVDMLASFALSGIEADKLYRLESFWSAEGRMKVDDLIDLNLERSWLGAHGLRSLRYGCVGSMPVKTYFPFAALENSKTGHFVGVQLYTPASWQIEVLCFEDTYRLVGGIADRDFGAWCRHLQPGESITTPKAVVAEADDLYTLCDRLIRAQHPAIAPVDEDLPVMFNEYCTTWGNPTAENIKAIADRISGLGFRYFVIDCGWYRNEAEWYECNGDWIPNKEMLPNGLSEVTDYLRARDMIPGIWFELESAGASSKAYYDYADHFLTRDGYPIKAGTKKFWDMEDPVVVEYLTERVIHQLRDNHFGYVKIDYNDTIGPGCDGYESAGAGLYRRVNASMDFFEKMTREIPGLVMENCASGGHRLEPSTMEKFTMASFSDAHECTCIPIIAANLHRAILPQQSQIWCVLRAEDSRERTIYSLVNTFLGRMCISGDVHNLSDAQMDLLRESIVFYHKAAPIIKSGKTTKIESTAHSYLHPEGYQIVERDFAGKRLTVAHRFENSSPIPAPQGKILASFGEASGDFTACAWISEIE